MKEDRKKIYEEWTGEKNFILERTMILYDRYFEANFIVRELESRGVEFSKLCVLDYGCACGDYGMVFARKGSKVSFVDIVPACVEFANHRMKLENFQVSDQEPNFVIFGEVLEHMVNPLETIQGYHEQGVKYFFTSSYPFRSDDPKDKYWKGSGDPPGHTRQACIQQPEVRKFLQNHYSSVRFDGAATLWTRKD